MVLGLQELVAKGVVEASEEEMDNLVEDDILAVATFCNQHSFSGKILTLSPGSFCNYDVVSDSMHNAVPMC